MIAFRGFVGARVFSDPQAILSLLAVIVSLLIQPYAFAQQLVSGDSLISGIFAGDEIQIRTTSRTAGAIDSLTWMGKEFVNSYDHGRQIQTTAHFNGLGSCYNPTEAGSRSDGIGAQSSSRLLELTATRNSISTRTQMAYWLMPGQQPMNCGPNVRTVRNNTVLSNHILEKEVTIGFHGMPNVVEYKIKYIVPESYALGTFEIVTGYMPVDFEKFWTLDRDTGRVASLSDGPGEQNFPVVFSTADERYALGVYNTKLPLSSWPRHGYGRWRFNKAKGPTVKWNCVERIRGVIVGSYSFRCFIVVGSLIDVQTSLLTLSRLDR